METNVEEIYSSVEESEDEIEEGDESDEETNVSEDCVDDDDEEDDEESEVDDDDDEDEEEEDEEEDDDNNGNDVSESECDKGNGNENSTSQQNEDDSSGEDMERCPICLACFRAQDIGSPESCDHSFCLECIQEWAKNVNTCPVDRKTFRLILARHQGEDKVFKQFPVEDKRFEEDEEEDPTVCEMCGRADRPDRLLLCDGCDLGFHCECLDPPLASVPVNEWFCSDCQLIRENAATERLEGRVRRQIARTQVSERVRRVLRDARAERAARRQRIAQIVEAQADNEFVNDTEPQPSTSTSSTPIVRSKTVPKKKTTRKKGTKKQTKKRKPRKTKSKTKTTKRKRKVKRKTVKGKKRKRTTKKKKASSTSSRVPNTTLPASSTIKGRIADKLGLVKPPSGRSMPLQKGGAATSSSKQDIIVGKSDVSSTLSILGHKDDLYSFADQQLDEKRVFSKPAISAEQFLSRSGKSSHIPLKLSISPVKRKIEIKTISNVKTESNNASSSSGTFDLLGSIMQSQNLLHKDSQDVTIHRDGSLSTRSKSSNMWTFETIDSSSIKNSNSDNEINKELGSYVPDSDEELLKALNSYENCDVDTALVSKSTENNNISAENDINKTEEDGSISKPENVSDTCSSGTNLPLEKELVTNNNSNENCLPGGDENVNENATNEEITLNQNNDETSKETIIGNTHVQNERDEDEESEEGEIKDVDSNGDCEEGEILDDEEPTTPIIVQKEPVIVKETPPVSSIEIKKETAKANYVCKEDIDIENPVEISSEEEVEDEWQEKFLYGSFVIANILYDVKSGVFQKKVEKAKKKEEKQKIISKKKEEKESKQNISKHKITFQDFLTEPEVFGVTAAKISKNSNPSEFENSGKRDTRKGFRDSKQGKPFRKKHDNSKKYKRKEESDSDSDSGRFKNSTHKHRYDHKKSKYSKNDDNKMELNHKENVLKRKISPSMVQSHELDPRKMNRLDYDNSSESNVPSMALVPQAPIPPPAIAQPNAPTGPCPVPGCVECINKFKNIPPQQINNGAVGSYPGQYAAYQYYGYSYQGMPRTAAPQGYPANYQGYQYPVQYNYGTTTRFSIVSSQYQANHQAVSQASRFPDTPPAPPPLPKQEIRPALSNTSLDMKTEQTKEEGSHKRLNRAPSPPPIRGVLTSDRVDSNFLLDEVKKGFRQLVEDAVRTALKGPYARKHITKDDYKVIFKKAVEKVCDSKETVVQQSKIQMLVDAYVFKIRKERL